MSASGCAIVAIAFPNRSEDERRASSAPPISNLGRGAAEYVRLGGFFYRRLKDRVTYGRMEHLAAAKRRDPQAGVVILSAHFGNFELLPTAHAMHWVIRLPWCIIRSASWRATRLMTFIRERAGVEIMRKHSAARRRSAALRRGDSVGIPFDQNAKRSEAIFVPFFNEIAATASGLARLVAISGASVVPVFIIRQPDGRTHKIEAQDEVPVQRSGDAEADVAENTRRFVRAIEDIVRRYPEQFLWTHRRYRTRPRGTPPVYDT